MKLFKKAFTQKKSSALEDGPSTSQGSVSKSAINGLVEDLAHASLQANSPSHSHAAQQPIDAMDALLSSAMAADSYEAQEPQRRSLSEPQEVVHDESVATASWYSPRVAATNFNPFLSAQFVEDCSKGSSSSTGAHPGQEGVPGMDDEKVLAAIQKLSTLPARPSNWLHTQASSEIAGPEPSWTNGDYLYSPQSPAARTPEQTQSPTVHDSNSHDEDPGRGVNSHPNMNIDYGSEITVFHDSVLGKVRGMEVLHDCESCPYMQVQSPMSVPSQGRRGIHANIIVLTMQCP